MKKIICLFFLLLSGCCSFDVLQASIPVLNPAEQKLPRLEIVLPKAQKGAERIAFDYFRRTFEDNLLQMTGSVEGYVELLPKYQIEKSENGWKTLSYITLGIGNLMGLPIGSWTTNVSLEIQFKNKKKEIIQKYYSKVKNTEYIGFYNYFDEEAKKASFLKGFDAAIDQISDQVKANKKPLFKSR